jgi:hypothetical protein
LYEFCSLPWVSFFPCLRDLLLPSIAVHDMVLNMFFVPALALPAITAMPALGGWDSYTEHAFIDCCVSFSSVWFLLPLDLF